MQVNVCIFLFLEDAQHDSLVQKLNNDIKEQKNTVQELSSQLEQAKESSSEALKLSAQIKNLTTERDNTLSMLNSMYYCYWGCVLSSLSVDVE